METTGMALNSPSGVSGNVAENTDVFLLMRQDGPALTLLVNKINNGLDENEEVTHSVPIQIDPPVCSNIVNTNGMSYLFDPSTV